MQAPTFSKPRTRQSVATRNMRAIIWMIIFAEAMFFFGLFTSYLFLRWDMPTWGPPGGQTLDPMLAMLNTVVLLSSIGLMHMAYRAVRSDRQQLFENLLIATMFAGVIFIGGQVYEFSTLGFAMSDGAYASIFFVMIGLHAIHVVIGVLIFMVVHLRASMGHFHAQHYIPVEMCALYWYFVALVWIPIVAAFYLV
ncbi:MAG: heme-copper oxidase subunit III [Chloroflexaceae bacterium]|nr:heme-copper oxidase subunit III [Chloroflexaceae bacterium]